MRRPSRTDLGSIFDDLFGGAEGIDDLIDVKDNLGATALDDLHPLASFAS